MALETGRTSSLTVTVPIKLRMTGLFGHDIAGKTSIVSLYSNQSSFFRNTHRESCLYLESSDSMMKNCYIARDVISWRQSRFAMITAVTG